MIRAAGTRPAEYIYYNATMVNGRSTGQFDLDDSSFEESRAVAIIEDASLYKLAIMRVVVNGGGLTLPCFQALLDTRQSDPNVTAYRVAASLEWEGSLPPLVPADVTITAGVNDTLLLNILNPSGFATARNVPVVIAPGTYAPAAYATLLEQGINVALVGAPVGPIDIELPAYSTTLRISNTLDPTLADSYTVELSFLLAATAGAALTMGFKAARTYKIAPGAFVDATNPVNFNTAIVRSPKLIATRPVRWVPEDERRGAPPTPPRVLDPVNDYYYAYSISHIVGLLNQGFEWLFDDTTAPDNTTGEPTTNCLLGQLRSWYTAQGYPEEFLPNLTTKPPEIVYDAASGLMTMYLDKYGFDGGPTPALGRTSTGNYYPGASENITLFFNTAYYALVRTFPMLSIFADKENGQSEFQLNPRQALTSTMPWSPDTTAWAVTQNGPATDTWPPVESIVVWTNSLPVIPEQVAPPTVSRSSGEAFASAGSIPGAASTVSAITDITLAVKTAVDWRGELVYSPTAEFRYIDLGSSPVSITQMSLQLGWRNKHSNLVQPLKMPPGGTVTAKLLFKLK